MFQKLTFPFLLLSAFGLQAQSPTPTIRCGQEIFQQIVRERHPALDQAFRATFDAAGQPAPAADRTPLTVNVVVHVVWKQAAENLSDAIIEDQIRVLNEDFNRQNADTGQLRTIFQPVAGQAGISFNLVAIERVQTSETFSVSLLGSNLLPEVKHTAQGGSDAWDTEHFLNIWVCKIQPLGFGGFELAQILGFAYPPNGLDNWPAGASAPNADEDGVVVDYRMFGSINPNTIPVPGGSTDLVVKGRTPTHEIAHYLGLRHIWGDGGLFGPNDCAQSDGVDDTPFASSQSNFDCDTEKNSCQQVDAFYDADMPDLVENFMDYSSESCMNMFTQGQVERLRNVLQGPRSGLLATVPVGNPTARAGGWRLYPNPARDFATAAFQPEAETEVRLTLLDAAGRVVWTQAPQLCRPEPQRLRVDLAGVAPGLYFVELRTEREVSVEKLRVLSSEF
jgi:hypothetical protein